MPRLPIITSQAIPALSDTALLARIVGLNRTPITQASLSSIALTLTDLTTGTVLQTALPLTIASVLFDSLQQSDAAWTKDSPQNPAPPPPVGDLSSGYNFRYVLPGALIPFHGHRYLAEVAFTTAAGNLLAQQWEWSTLAGYR